MTPKCAAQHYGAWMVDAAWFHAAISDYRAGRIGPGKVDTEYKPTIVDGIAILAILGQMTKGDSSFGGTSTVRVRQAIREAAADPSIRSILLNIESPGGTVAGTAELAADVAQADTIKPVYAQIDDMGASAAYWVASQARKVYANATAMVGSLGTVLYVEDSSKAAEAAGVKVIPVTTGAYKATGADGTEVTDDQLEYLQGLVDDLNSYFKAGVRSGRDLTVAATDSLFDGRVHVAAKAQELGLIDGVQSMDDTMAMIQRRHKAEDSRSRKVKAETLIRGMELETGIDNRGHGPGR
jgi:signal peptide peptidase SppA